MRLRSSDECMNNVYYITFIPRICVYMKKIKKTRERETEKSGDRKERVYRYTREQWADDVGKKGECW